MKVTKMPKAAVVICLALFVFAPIAARAQDGDACVPTVLVEPSSVTVKEGDVFNVSVVIENLAVNHGMAGIQFFLTWNKTVLTSLGMNEVLYHTITPQDEWDNIWEIRCTVNNTGGYAEYACLWFDLRRAVAGGYCPVNGISGNHTLAIATMKAVAAVSTTLHLSCVKVGDMNAAPLLNTDENAHQTPNNTSSGNATLPQQTGINNSGAITADLQPHPIMVPYSPWTVPSGRAPTTILTQNFDNEPTGSIPQEWTLGNPSLCSLTLNDSIYCGDSGKSARYADTASYSHGCAPVTKAFENQYGHLEFSFAILAENPDYFSLYIDKSLMGQGANIYLLPDMNFAYYDGNYHYLSPFSLNTWYQIKMIIDVPTNTYDIYIDNTLQAKGAHFRYFGGTTYLNEIEIGQNSYETPSAYIDDILLTAQEYKAPVATTMTLTGNLDYLLQEDVNVRLDALVKDFNTMSPISNANVTLNIYYPNGSLWISDKMLEKLAGSGIYEWESSATIGQLSLGKGVYLVQAQASAKGELPSTDILLFHIDPPSSAQATSPILEFYYVAIATAILASAILGTVLLRRHKRELNLSKTKLF